MISKFILSFTFWLDVTQLDARKHKRFKLTFRIVATHWVLTTIVSAC